MANLIKKFLGFSQLKIFVLTDLMFLFNVSFINLNSKEEIFSNSKLLYPGLLGTLAQKLKKPY